MKFTTENETEVIEALASIARHIEQIEVIIKLALYRLIAVSSKIARHRPEISS